MDGFPTKKQNVPTRQHGLKQLPLLLAGTAVAFSLSINSGCATMQGAKKDLHFAMCGEADSPCACSCGECTAKLHAADEATVHREHDSSTHVAGKHDVVIPPQEPNRQGAQGLQPKLMTIEGMPGVWTPEQSNAPNYGFADAPISTSDRSANTLKDFQQSPNEPFPGVQAMQGNSSVPFGQSNRYPEAYSTPDLTRNDEELKECRTQIHVLSQQISQMMQAHDSIKASQETLQQSHEREILELKLQQATADRDRLQRERVFDRELQKQRERDLETIDSFSQIIENVAQTPSLPVAAPGDNLGSVPRASAKSGEGQSKTSQFLPAVDESR